MAVVECKRPDIEISKEVLEQALRYSAVLQVPFLFLTNGHLTYICRKTGDGYAFLDKAPVYEEMLAQCRQ